MTGSPSIVVRTPSWGPQTFHSGPASVHGVHAEDARRCGCTPLDPVDLVAALEEGRAFSFEGSGCRVEYRVERLD